MRMHFRAYHALIELWLNLVRGAEGFLEIPKATGKRRITIVRHSHKTLDDDNLRFAMKPVFDILRPQKVTRGIYKNGKKKGQFWQRVQLGHGLIQEDSPEFVERIVTNGPLLKGQKPYTTILIEEIA